MTNVLPSSVEKVIEEFSKIPGVGVKTAARMTYHFLRSRRGDATRLAQSLNEMESSVKTCAKCFNVTDKEVCDICDSPRSDRDSSKLCIVEEPLDVVAFENAGVYKGLYFVLGGVISPADGIGAEELRFPELKRRVEELIKETSNRDENEKVRSENPSEKASLEVIVATNPSLEGEATSTYIQDLLQEFVTAGKVLITRLAMGLPTGADLEYADRLTLSKAVSGRVRV